MIDLDELIAKLRRVAELANESQSRGHIIGYPRYEDGVYVENSLRANDLDTAADALVSVRAERDAALARIAELEEKLGRAERMKAAHMRSSHDTGKYNEELLARIAEAAKLHRKYTYYDLEDSCPDMTDEHREEHHHEASDDIGEFYCDQMPTGDVCCDTCRDVNGDRMDWPCETAKILGLNEGDER